MSNKLPKLKENESLSRNLSMCNVGLAAKQNLSNVDSAPLVSGKGIPDNEQIHIRPEAQKQKLQMKSENESSELKLVPAQEPSIPIIQKQEDVLNTEESPDVASSVPGICSLNPVFPDFRCFIIHLKRNIDTNLYNNAHHFTQIASLYPDDSQMMQDAFMRYGLGVNILETSYQFLGADAGLATGLAYGTGIGLKAFDLFSNGELLLDYQINLTDDVNLDLRLDLHANPDDLLDIRDFNTGVGISGHF